MATWEFEHTPFAIIWQPNTKGVIIMLDKILDILNLKEAVRERRERNRLLNQLQAEISSNLKRLEEAIPDVNYAAHLSRERKSWRVGISPKCTEYYTDAYQRLRDQLGLLKPDTIELLNSFYDQLGKAMAYKEKLEFKSDDIRQLVQQHIDYYGAQTEEEARSSIYPALLYDLRSELDNALKLGKELMQAIKKERCLISRFRFN
jgi:chromosome segregation ATPase